MRENEVKVTSKRQFRDAIIARFAPLHAGAMFGANLTLEQAQRAAADLAEKEIRKTGVRPTPKKPFYMNIDMPAAVEEFIRNMPKYGWEDLPESKKRDSMEFRTDDVEMLSEMFQAHPWTLSHIDHIRRAADSGPERFELARKIHRLGITPRQVEEAVKINADLNELVAKVESGQSVDESLFELTPKKQKRSKAPPPAMANNKAAETKTETEENPTPIRDATLIEAMKQNGVTRSERQSIPFQIATKYADEGIAPHRIGLAYAVHRIQQSRGNEPSPMRELKALLNSPLEHPDHILFADQVRRETGEKPEVVLYAMQRHAEGKDLNRREADIVLKAGELQAQHPEETWPDLKKQLKRP